MKSTAIIAATIFLFVHSGNAQLSDDVYCTDFEQANDFIFIDTGGTWQIGKPLKVNFNNSYSPVNSILTDTSNSYPKNDTSYFYAVYGPYTPVGGGIGGIYGVWNYLGGFAPIQIEFKHRFDTDSLTDFGSVELSVDSGTTWINMLTPGHGWQFPQDVSNTHIFESTGDTIYDSLAITGRSDGWIHTIILKDMNSILDAIHGHGGGWHNVDSIIVRFAFYSDSLENFRDGWQIDDLCISYRMGLMLVGVEDLKTENVWLYPNPASGEIMLNIPELKSINSVSIYNILGNVVHQEKISENQRSISVRTLPSGVYYLTINAVNNKVYSEKFVINHQ